MNLIRVRRECIAAGIAGEPGNRLRVRFDPTRELMFSNRVERSGRLCSRNGWPKELAISPNLVAVHAVNALEARRDGRAVLEVDEGKFVCRVHVEIALLCVVDLGSVPIPAGRVCLKKV